MSATGMLPDPYPSIARCLGARGACLLAAGHEGGHSTAEPRVLPPTVILARLAEDYAASRVGHGPGLVRDILDVISTYVRAENALEDYAAAYDEGIEGLWPETGLRLKREAQEAYERLYALSDVGRDMVRRTSGPNG